MNLMKWNRRRERNPEFGAPLTLFRNELDRTFDRFWKDPWSVPIFFEQQQFGWSPSIDVADSETEITVRAEIPGVDPANINVSVDDNFLTISGEKSMSKEESDKEYFFCERSFGSFARRIELPMKVHADKITANYSEGVLSIRAPKVESSKPRKVDVKVEGRTLKPAAAIAPVAPAPGKRVPVQPT